MQQHVLDDGIGALAVLHDLIEVVAQGIGQFIDLRTRFLGQWPLVKSILQFVDQLDRDTGEVIHEVERVLDLVGDARRQLTERGQFLRLDKTVLSGSQII